MQRADITPISIHDSDDIITLDSALFQVPVQAMPLEHWGISVYLIYVTPEVATTMLARKNTNRSFRLVQLNKLKRAMTLGRWEVNGETVIFDHDGRLIEGQHRLKAVVDSGVSVWVLCVHGIDRERFKTMGQGSKRTTGDILNIQGVKNSRNIAAALRWVYRYENDLMSNPHPNITDDELADTLPNHLAIADSFPFGGKAHGLAAPGMVTALHYLCSKREKATANDFFWKFATGEHLAQGDVVLVLRNRFLRALGKKGAKYVIRDEQKAPMIANAWNLIRKRGWVKIKDANPISWHGKVGQKFPKIL
jgi:hypothetical protein